MQLHLTALGSE